AAAGGELRQSRPDPPGLPSAALHARRRAGWKRDRELEPHPAAGSHVLPMIPRVVLAACLVVLMLGSSTVTYIYLGSRQSRVAAVPEKPTSATPTAQRLRLPGTLFLIQSGALYGFSAGRFRQLTSEGGWMQPSL